jgi:hypothetical protein
MEFPYLYKNNGNGELTMANRYIVIENQGHGFFTANEKNNGLDLLGTHGNVYTIKDNTQGVCWINRMVADHAGVIKTKAEAQAIIDAVVDIHQAEYDALTQEQKDLSRGPPVRDTLN